MQGKLLVLLLLGALASATSAWAARITLPHETVRAACTDCCDVCPPGCCDFSWPGCCDACPLCGLRGK